MSLSIVIADSRPVYRPGDQIVGAVIYKADARPIQAQQVLVELKHTAKCRFGLQELETLYSLDMTLNKQTIELLEAPTTLQPTHELPFKFIIPESTGYITTPFQEPTRLYNDSPDQLLPPTFDTSKKELASGDGLAKIRLGLYASIIQSRIQSNLFKKEEIQAILKLDFQPQRRTVHVDWGMVTKQNNFEARTPLLAEMNGQRQRSLSIKEKIATSIKSSSLPAASFDVLMSLPMVAVVGQPIPMFIGLVHDAARNNAQDYPTVSLNTLVIKLVTTTSLRGLSETRSFRKDDYLPASHNTRVKTIDLGKLATPLELNDIIDIREVMELKVPTDAIQSFSTFNIARSYHFHVSLGIECAKQKLSTTFEHKFTMLAAHDYDEEHPPGIDTTTTSMVHADDLPSWEESGGYGDHGVPVMKEELPPQYS